MVLADCASGWAPATSAHPTRPPPPSEAAYAEERVRLEVQARPGWRIHRRADILVLTDASEPWGEAVAERCAAVLADVRVRWPGIEAPRPMIARLFATSAAYHAWGGVGGSVAFIPHKREEVVLFVQTPGEIDPSEHPDAATLQAAAMIAVRWYLSGWPRKSVPPIWLRAGLARCYETWLPGRPAPSFSTDGSCWGIAQGGSRVAPLPLPDLLAMPDAHFYASHTTSEAFAWALCHYLLVAGPARQPAMADRLRAVPGCLLDRRRAGDDTANATAAALAGLALSVLEADLLAWLRGK